MSEYQYYEFVAIDQPLTAARMAELRARSTRVFAASPSGMAGARHWCGGSKMPGYGGESPTLDLIAGRSHPSHLSGIIIQSLMTSLADY